jgi:hypothetical protein
LSFPEGNAGEPLLDRGVFAGGDLFLRLLAPLAGLSEPDGRKRADRKGSLFAEIEVPKSPKFAAARLDQQEKAAAVGELVPFSAGFARSIENVLSVMVGYLPLDLWDISRESTPKSARCNVTRRGTMGPCLRLAHCFSLENATLYDAMKARDGAPSRNRTSTPCGIRF